MKNLKRITSLLLCMVMMLTLVPAITPTVEAAGESGVDMRGLDIGYGKWLPWVIWKENTDDTGVTTYAYLYAMDSGYRIDTTRFDQSNTPVTGEHVQYFYWPNTPWKNNNGKTGI